MNLHNPPYISYIKIGKQSMIPPLLTEELRAEMRRYRELAVSLEKRKIRRPSIDSGVIITSSGGSSAKENENRENYTVAVNDIPDQFSNISDFCPKKENYNDLNSVRKNNENTELFVKPLKPSAKERRNSYTLETPSPVMIKYIQSLKNDQIREKTDMNELFINTEQTNNFPFPPDQDIPQMLAFLNDFCDNMAVKTNKLTLVDLDSTSVNIENLKLKRKLWNASGEKFPSYDINNKSFLEGSKSISLPNSCQASPICKMRTCESSECLKLNSESNMSASHSGNSAPVVDCLNQSYDNFCNDNDFELPRAEADSSSKQLLYQFNNDSFNQDFGILDFNSSVNTSRESDTCQESVLSDCSSVSLSKFLLKKKSLDDQEVELAAFFLMKEQLELKHRNELTRLLNEQQKEHDLLKEEFDQMSYISKCSVSPKSNYVYSRDVVLKKYSASECSFTSEYCKSRSADNSNRSECETPKLLIRSASWDRKIQINSDKKMEKLKEKFVAIVRGYWTRRLFKTARVQLLVQTIKDCLLTAVSLQSENELGLSELDLQNRLLQQLTVAFHELHDIFSLPLNEQLVIISADREKKRHMKKITTPLPLSEATKRTLQRRTSTNSAPPAQRKFTRKRCKSASSISSDANSCRSTPGYRRPIATAIMSQKYSVSRNNRRPWR